MCSRFLHKAPMILLRRVVELKNITMDKEAQAHPVGVCTVGQVRNWEEI